MMHVTMTCMYGQAALLGGSGWPLPGSGNGVVMSPVVVVVGVSPVVVVGVSPVVVVGVSPVVLSGDLTSVSSWNSKRSPYVQPNVTFSAIALQLKCSLCPLLMVTLSSPRVELLFFVHMYPCVS